MDSGEASNRTETTVSPQEPVVGPEALTGLLPGDTMIAASKKILSFHLDRMLASEAGTIAGVDIEQLHDMRVASRRMRAAFRLFRDFLDQGRARQINKGLRRTGRTLGPVRDLDVFWQKTSNYFEDDPALHPDNLDLVKVAWETQRQSARREMIAYLKSKRYRRFKKRFEDFLDLPEAALQPREGSQAEPKLVKHVVPFLIVQKLMTVMAYDPLIEGDQASFALLHQLRIAAKRLRYALEFFEEVLSPQAVELIVSLKQVQDQLGDLQDAAVASRWLTALLESEIQKAGPKVARPRRKEQILGLQSYLKVRQSERDELRRSFLPVWSDFKAQPFNRAFQRNLGLP